MGGMPAGHVSPRRAPVVPRACPTDGGEVLPLEDWVFTLLRRGTRGVVNLSGDAGSGKSTALAHLASVLPPDAPVRLFDGQIQNFKEWQSVDDVAKANLVLTTSRPGDEWASNLRLTIAPWGHDDLIEYLLTQHRDKCQPVMFKVKSYAQHLPIGGSPELWARVLDTMAGDDAIADVGAALRRVLAPLLSDPKMAAGHACLARLRTECANGDLSRVRDPGHPLARHRAVQLVLASELIVRDLCDGNGDWADLEGKLPHDLIVETARLAAHWPAAVERLTQLVAGNKRRTHPMAASLLVAVQPDWRPRTGEVPTLSGAYVAGAHWAGVDLRGGALSGADFERADLSNANLTGASASCAILRGAKLRDATLDELCAIGSDLARAQLTGASVLNAKLGNVDLHAADLRAADLSNCDLTKTDLSDAILTSAKLCDAVLDETNLDGTDLVGADFTRAILHRVRLCDANLSATSFYRADFRSCDLEGLRAPHGKFAGAKLKGSYLTGAVMPHADFHSADLRNAGLADVDWENADLRDADLRGASFHLGSTRSGLVGSTIPCEGSKTGFYTDDFDDREFKDPAEIRKANLCGADLRGANVKGVDFYLVDLRGAQYTDKQRHHFKRCGAILD